MGAPFLRNDLIACAGVTALLCAVAFLIWPHAANSNPQRSAVAPVAALHSAAGSATAPATPAAPHKPSAYGEAFVPPPPAQTRPDPGTSKPMGATDVAGERYRRVAPEVMAENLISAPPPAYPLLARIAHVRGQVTVQAVISSDGAVSAARALQGHHLLRGAAVAAVRRQRYRPYRVDGQPANVSTVITVDFGSRS